MNLTKPWSTHIGVLVKVLLLSSGEVIELGTGPYSTPLLHWICKDMHRKLVSYENHPQFYEYAKLYESHSHKTIFLNDWNQIDNKAKRGVVFIDHHPMERRGIDAIRFKDSADYIVMHDTEKPLYYSEVWQHFKYVYNWKGCVPWISVVSNFKDLSILKSKTLHLIP